LLEQLKELAESKQKRVNLLLSDRDVNTINLDTEKTQEQAEIQCHDILKRQTKDNCD